MSVPWGFFKTSTSLADAQSLDKLSAIDAGVTQHFQLVARFEATASSRDADAASFGAFSAAMAKDNGYRPVSEPAISLIYTDAIRRAAKPDCVSLDLIALRTLLAEADRIAAAGSSDIIRRADVEDAVREEQKSFAP